MKICRRCFKEKPLNEFFDDDRGSWCMLCNYEFLKTYGDDPMYADSREFTHPNLRDQPRSAGWVLQRLSEGLKSIGVLSETKLGYDAAQKIQGGRLADATRLPGERALMCDVCSEKFGGETVFKAHRKYGTQRGRPGPNATLKCYSLEGSRFSRDSNGVWRGATPKFG